MNDFNNDSEQLNLYCKGLINRFGEPVFKSWMSDIHIERLSGEEVALSTASTLRRETLIQRFKPSMHDEWNRALFPTKKFSIILRQRALNEAHSSRSKALGGDSVSVPSATHDKSFGGDTSKGDDKKDLHIDDVASPLDDRSTFECYAVDPTNSMAHSAAQWVFNEGTSNDLIYIYGDSGVGKTHLLHAVGHEWKKRHGDQGCAYLTHSSLTNCFVDAVWSNSILALHKELLSQKILLIDDIHLLGGKNRTQQEVLNMVNAFMSSGRQLVIAGEAAPSRLENSKINPRLADRLAGGIAVPIEPGGVELRVKVLKMRAESAPHKCTVSDDAIAFIAANFPHSMREAIGALNQLLLAYGDMETAVTREQAQAALMSRLATSTRRGTLEDCAAAAADAFGISVDEIKGRAQPQRIAKARHAFVYVSREILKESFPRIANVLGRDHTTAMSSYRRAQALLERHKDFQDAVEKIRIAVGG